MCRARKSSAAVARQSCNQQTHPADHSYSYRYSHKGALGGCFTCEAVPSGSCAVSTPARWARPDTNASARARSSTPVNTQVHAATREAACSGQHEAGSLQTYVGSACTNIGSRQTQKALRQGASMGNPLSKAGLLFWPGPTALPFPHHTHDPNFSPEVSSHCPSHRLTATPPRVPSHRPPATPTPPSSHLQPPQPPLAQWPPPGVRSGSSGVGRGVGVKPCPGARVGLVAGPQGRAAAEASQPLVALVGARSTCQGRLLQPTSAAHTHTHTAALVAA